MRLYSKLSDAELTDLLKAGNDLAYTEIYERYSGLLYLFAYKKLKNEDEAKDIVQDIFIALWNRRKELSFHTALRSYLFKAVNNSALNLFVHYKYRSDYISSFEQFLQQYHVPEADELLQEKELSNIIDTEISLLPEKMREIFQLSRKQQLSHKEIADKLGISELTVKTQVKRAIRILRLRLGLILYLVYLFGNIKP